MDVVIREDNVNGVIDEIRKRKLRALEKIGLQAERYAKLKCPVDTGNLRNSITHTSDKDNAYVGTNMSYAGFVELGEDSHGREEPDGRKSGNKSHGHNPQPFLRPAATEHESEYRQILKEVMLYGV